jgi:hypothetical protein
MPQQPPQEQQVVYLRGEPYNHGERNIFAAWQFASAITEPRPEAASLELPKRPPSDSEKSDGAFLEPWGRNNSCVRR